MSRETVWWLSIYVAAGFLPAFVLAGCQAPQEGTKFAGLEGMAWRVTCETKLKDLDARYTDGLYDLHVSRVCRSDNGSDNFTECPAHGVLWGRYWDARRRLNSAAHVEKCDGTVAS